MTMKAEELMQFDWVCLEDDPTPRQVDFIKTGEVGLYWNKIVTPPYIKPILLTPKILEKNGWTYNDEDEKFAPQTWVGGGLMLQGADDCGYCIVVTSDWDDEDTNSTPFVILYVHELQHALKLRRIKKEIIL